MVECERVRRSVYDVPMPIAESLVADVVAHTSERMKDGSFAQLAVGNFVQRQPNLAQFLTAKAARLGGAGQLVELVFHAELMCECFRRALGRELPVVSFATLDLASQGEAKKRFAEREPALSSYVVSNVDAAAVQSELFRVGLALSMAAAG